jgi:Spx/MgsR family transcriptional regulator
MIKIYGLKNCDTCRKALKWMTAEGVRHEFADFRVNGLDEHQAAGWLAKLGHDTLINRRGTTWRQLPDDQKLDMDNDKALALVLENPALIKRPVFEIDCSVMVGFTPGVMAELAKAA